MAKVARQTVEKFHPELRTARQSTMKTIKEIKGLGKDEARRLEQEIQKVHDNTNKQLSQTAEKRSREIIDGK
eukprot:Clim_evm57s152 gene=Clim_evmTU57s152